MKCNAPLLTTSPLLSSPLNLSSLESANILCCCSILKGGRGEGGGGGDGISPSCYWISVYIVALFLD